MAIVPKSKSKADFAGIDNYYYIIRPDLNVYMRSENFRIATDLEIFSLHQACRDGDHYLGHEDGSFYIINSNNYRRVTDLSTDENPVVSSLHPKCQGGDHYFSAFGSFYIVFQGLGKYRKTTCLHTNTNAKEYSLHPECQNGLYYWGIKNFYYYLTVDDKWGVQYVRCTDFHLNKVDKVFSMHESVINFLPGGLAITKGRGYGRWECIKSIPNDSQTPIELNEVIPMKVGFEKQKMSSIEHNWKISLSVFAETGDLSARIVKATFSLEVEYGGMGVDTAQQSWKEATEVQETLSGTLDPQKVIYVYAYKLGLGKEPILHCQKMKILDETDIPVYSPLPFSTN